MRLVPISRERWQQIAGEFAKFGTIGLINAVVNYAVFNALILTIFAHGQLKANVVATVIAMTGSYFMNRHWTYRHRPKSAVQRELLLFFLFNIVGLVIELGVLALSKYGLGLTSLLALNVFKTLGLVLGTLFRFWAYRTFVFRVSSAPAAEQAAVLAANAAGTAGTGASTSANGGSASASPAGTASPARPVRVEREFDQLTARLEAEFSSELDDVDIERELADEKSRAAVRRRR